MDIDYVGPAALVAANYAKNLPAGTDFPAAVASIVNTFRELAYPPPPAPAESTKQRVRVKAIGVPSLQYKQLPPNSSAVTELQGKPCIISNPTATTAYVSGVPDDKWNLLI